MKKIRSFFSRPFFKETAAYAATHKTIATLVTVVIIAVGYWSVNALTGSASATRYVTTTVQKDTLISSVTGTGQVSTSNQVDLKSQGTGEVTYLPIAQGQFVKAGTIIAELDATDLEKAVRDAEVNLESEQIALQKQQEPADALSLTQAQDSLAKAEQSLQNSQANLAQAHDDGFNSVANAFLDLPGIVSGLHDILYNWTPGLGSQGQPNLSFYSDTIVRNGNDRGSTLGADADAKYQAALTAYTKNYADYKAASRFSDATTTNALILETYNTSKTIADSIKSAGNLIQLYEDTITSLNSKPATAADSQLASLSTYTSKTNNAVGNLLSAQTTITADASTIMNANQSILENTQSLAKLQAGADPLDIASSQLSLKQRQNALLDAEENLANATIRAPFDGTLAKLDVKKGDQISTGAVIGTMITPDLIAVIPLNEVDIAKIQVGQKATLTFDAIDGLTEAGEVESVDTLGTVSQGVVTYNVTVKLLAADPRIKPGMSITVAIVTDVEQDVLDVPNSAIKTSGGSSTVMVFDSPLQGGESAQGALSSTAPRSQQVELGTSNDTSTVITSGLKEGDTVVVRTITAAAAKTTTAASATSLLGGNNRGGTGAGAARGFTGAGRGN